MELLDINDPHPKKHRRWFLRTVVIGVGGAAVVGAWGWHRGAFDPERGEAFAAWDQWQAGDDAKLRLISAAVLAPSKHNTQPWEFRVEKQFINVFIDPLRTVGALDPLHREAYFSTGCCIANMMLAAEAEGLTATPVYLPDREFLWNWVARFDVEPGAKKQVNELYQAIPKRHTNRGPYDMARAVPAKTLQEIAQTGSPDGAIRTVWLDKAQQQAFGTLTVEATETIIADDQGIDGTPWYRTSWETVQTEADGITMDAAMFPPKERAMKKFLMGPTAAEFDNHFVTMTKANVASMPAVGILTVPDAKDPVAQITAGIAWQRMALHATSLGLVMQPLTAAFERADREIAANATDGKFKTALQNIVGGQGDPMFAFRLGYPTVPSIASPRRGLDLVVFSEKKKPKKRYTFTL